jgi:hypothetical protein
VPHYKGQELSSAVALPESRTAENDLQFLKDSRFVDTAGRWTRRFGIDTGSRWSLHSHEKILLGQRRAVLPQMEVDCHEAKLRELPVWWSHSVLDITARIRLKLRWVTRVPYRNKPFITREVR